MEGRRELLQRLVYSIGKLMVLVEEMRRRLEEVNIMMAKTINLPSSKLSQGLSSSLGMERR